MSESVIEIVEASTVLPLRHQIGKFLVAAIATFVATKYAEKAYDATFLKSFNNQQATKLP